MSKIQYIILHRRIATPIWDLAMEYESSALFVKNKLVDPKVVKAFGELKKALQEQLKSINVLYYQV